MHAYIVVSLMARVWLEEAGAIGRVEDVDLDGDLPRLWYCARIGPGRHEDAEVVDRLFGMSTAIRLSSAGEPARPNSRQRR
jgi:hypothetical protein